MPSFFPSPEAPPTIETANDLASPKCDPKDVSVYSSPWITGTRATAYYGPLSSNSFFATDWDTTITAGFDDIRKAAAILGANAIVGTEIHIDPFADPPTLQIIGTAAELVPLF